MMEADRGLRNVLRWRVTVGGSAVASSTYILEELSATIVRLLGENSNLKASPAGKAADEFALIEMRLMRVLRGRKYTSKRLRRASAVNLAFSRDKSFRRNGPEMMLFDSA